MSGHSKWATIKHKKAATDAKRGRIFTRVIREITIAARIGGGDPNSNPRLRAAILAGKNENMPNENIERAVLRGTGQLEGEQYEEVTFEGYGPGGVGMLIQAVTTNRNRIVGEFRHLISKNGGNLAEAGAVGWMFQRKGEIVVPKEQASEEKMLDVVLEAATAGQVGHHHRRQQGAVLGHFDATVREATLVAQPHHLEFDVFGGVTAIDEVRGKRVGRQISGQCAGAGHERLRHQQAAECPRRVLAGMGSDEDVVAHAMQVQHRHQLVEVRHRPSLVARLEPIAQARRPPRRFGVRESDWLIRRCPGVRLRR